MDIARLNFSHGLVESHEMRLQNIHTASEKTGKKCEILQDLGGPKIRISDFASGTANLKEGDVFTLTTEYILGDEKKVTVNYPTLPTEVQKGHFIFLRDGSVKLEVEDINGNDVMCKVLVGGELRDKSGVNLPNSDLSAKCLTEKDLADLEFGIKNKVAYLSAEANGLLRRWLDARKALGLGRSKRVFTTLKGGLLAGAYLRELAARKGEEAGIGWRIHPHALRHTFATNLLRDTGNLALVQDALGHSDPETTRIYAKTVNSDLARALTRNDQQPEPAPAGPEALALAAKIAAMTPEQRQALTALLAGEPVASDGAQEATGSRQTGGVGVPRPITPAGPRKTRQKPTKTTDNAV